MTDGWAYLVAVFATAFTVNGLPHYLHGVSGERFPTPFSGGAGTLDTPLRNVLWGSGNLLAGGALFWLIWPSMSNPAVLAEVAGLAVVLGALLGKALSRPRQRAG